MMMIMGVYWKNGKIFSYCLKLYLNVGGDERACLLNDETTVTKATMRASGDWVKIDEDGALKYLGRHDDQVKRHGKRINLLQIEKVLNFIQ